MHHNVLIDYQWFASQKVDYSKIYLFFLRKIEDLTFFFIDSLRTEGKKAKTALWSPD